MSKDNIQRTPPSRHPRYYDSEYLTFAVDEYLFRLPVRRLKESKYFQDMLGSEHLGGSVEGTSDEHPIALGGITSFEMESFVEILDARVFGKKAQREWKQLAAALHLVTMWEFEDIRTSLVEDMSQIISKGGVEPIDRIEVSIQCRVSDWLHPAYQALCDRAEGVTTEEAKRLGMDRLAAIYRVRDRRHASTAAQNAHTGGHPLHYCGYCGCNRYSNYLDCGHAYTPTVPVVQTPTLPTLDLIKAEDILSSLDGPLPYTRA
ncbi:hypothetical protein FRC00_001491 [Tulasnella sp. 408]|nr:hypothetical protein FRC00_001491 [Tulasnella sp. 408]